MSDMKKESQDLHSRSDFTSQPQPVIESNVEEERNDTISDLHDQGEGSLSRSRPITALTRNLSEMSIECSTVKAPPQAPVVTTTDVLSHHATAEPTLILDDVGGLSSSNKLLIQEKVKTVFELPDSESLVNEFPCYLIRLVTIPGWMYITDNHICFYASLPGKKKGPYKAGYLSKKNHITSPRTYRYYFELRNHVLSWYSSAESKYLPLHIVDLKCITKIEASKLKKHGIRLTTTNSHHYTIIADSELSQKEWMDELRKGVFVAQHAGNSVRIVLPFSKITMVEKPSVFQFAANIKIKFMDEVEGSGDDYYFAFFPDIEMAYNEIMTIWKTHAPSKAVVLLDSLAEKKRPQSLPAAATNKATNSNSFLSFDSFLENMSPAALPTMLLGKLMNVTSLFQSGTGNGNTTAPSGNPQSEEEELEEDETLSSSDNEYEAAEEVNTNQHSSSIFLSIKIPSISKATTTTNDTAGKKLKRNSLFFNKAPTQSEPNVTITADSPSPSSSDAVTAATTSASSPELILNSGGGTSDISTTASNNDDSSAAASTATSSGTRPRSGTFNHLSKIPRAVSDAIKHQVLHSDEFITPAVSSTSSGSLQLPEQPQQQNRNRSSSLHTLRHHISPFYLYNKINNAPANSSSETVNTELKSTHSGDISLIPSTTTTSLHNIVSPTPVKIRTHRATSLGSMLLSGGSKTWHKFTPGVSDTQQLPFNESQHRHPKGPMWLNTKMTRELKEALEAEQEDRSLSSSEEVPSSDGEDSVDIPTSMEHTVHIVEESDPQILEEEQQTMNDHLNANFPMLLKTEIVEAAFKASFWRTIPYPGKIYITDRYFCFRSKILAGQQKLIVPWTDVIQVNKLKSKSYYLMHGMTMIVKNMTDEIYFDFSSMELRDNCYAVCQLKYENKTPTDASSIISKDSRSGAFSMSSIMLGSPEHVEPPMEYDGPPLLSNSSFILKQPLKKFVRPDKPLHITCLTIGSRGDVQPYVALCKELQKDGHRCRIATHPEYEKWIKQHGIEFRSVGGDPGELMKLCIDNSFLSVSFIREGTKFFYKWFDGLLQSAYEACQGTDILIESPSAMIGVHMAEKLEIPYFRSMPFPFTRTTKFPHPFAVQSTAGGRIYNDMTYVMIDMALWAGTAKHVNRFRRNILHLPATNLDRLQLWKVPHIYSFSPTVVHPPKDWPDYIHCTGYWFLDNPDQSWKPNERLVKFLDQTEDKRPIVYIGFGSIIVPDAAETTNTIVDAVLKSGVKAIISKGWSTRAVNHKTSDTGKEVKEEEEEAEDEILLDQHPGTIYHLNSVPHDWLFPKIQGVVHHGGAGTTAAGLRAGLPTVIKPFFGDQRFWGQRLEELGVGLCINKISKNQLADALITITQNKTMIAKALAIGETIRKENGPRNAAESIYREFEFAKDQRLMNPSS